MVVNKILNSQTAIPPVGTNVLGFHQRLRHDLPHRSELSTLGVLKRTVDIARKIAVSRHLEVLQSNIGIVWDYSGDNWD